MVDIEILSGCELLIVALICSKSLQKGREALREAKQDFKPPNEDIHAGELETQLTMIRNYENLWAWLLALKMRGAR